MANVRSNFTSNITPVEYLKLSEMEQAHHANCYDRFMSGPGGFRLVFFYSVVFLGQLPFFSGVVP